MSESKTNINWFPGHMAKARREMSERIKLVDMVIEIRDARIPYSSKNPMLDEITNNKPRLVILSKKDKAEAEITAKWVKYFESKGMWAIDLDLVHDKQVNTKVANACNKVMAEKVAKLKAKGLKHVEIKAMVVGIPNVGKSTLINGIAKKKAAQTGDRPGVTKNLQWIKISSDLSLLDTPGVLYPKFEDEMVGLKLAVTGAINDNILPLQQVREYALEYLFKKHPEKLANRFQVDVTNDDNLVDRICLSRGWVVSDGQPDYTKADILIIREIRDNLLGAISWEEPDENC